LAYDIEIKGLVKRYGSVTAVDGLDLLVRKGEMMGLIGPDGAGKTTTLRMLCGLILPDAGSCRVAGRDTARETPLVRNLIGYMPQRFSLYPDLTAEENLRFFADLFGVEKGEREKHLKRLLAFNRLAPFAKRRASALSGGMKQKLALSCALIHTPQVLLLDEPTTGVDPLSRREFWDILHELKKDGVTLLVTTPYMDEAAKCDRVALMNAGRLLHVDTPAALPKRFPYTLLELTCENRMAAARALSDSGRFRSVQMYGDRIHLSGEGGADGLSRRALDVLAERKIKGGRVRPAKPGIEDVFIELLVPDSPPVNQEHDRSGR
jgi:ABC-2 type transport system ATP-binding protein